MTLSLNFLLRSVTLVLFALFLIFTPPPLGITHQAWILFAIFITTIGSILLNLLPIVTASIIALSVSVLTGVMDPIHAYSGFSESFILLIVAAFLVSHAVHKSGLGKRISLHIIHYFGSSTLGLGYSLIATDMLIAPAFPSNTARSGVLYPIAYGLAYDCESKIADGTRKRAGAYLMMTSMAGLTISSALWLTAMAANPLGAEIAKTMGVQITFGSWLLASIVPVTIAFISIPYLLYRIFPPELTSTPEAPQQARILLDHMGPISRNEWITGAVFISMLVLWSLSGIFPIDKTAVAFGGLGILMVTRVFGVEDFKSQGEALSTLIWFSILFAMSTELAHLGFMDALAHQASGYLTGLSWMSVYLILTILYVVIHYFFVSQSAHMLALFGVFLTIAIGAGVPGELMAMMLLFATNFNAIITPQGSSANAIYLSSSYITAREIYIYGGAVTLLNLIIFLGIGTPWILLISR
jgi:DASS family divalent anion:Na+ symporter